MQLTSCKVELQRCQLKEQRCEALHLRCEASHLCCEASHLYCEASHLCWKAWYLGEVPTLTFERRSSHAAYADGVETSPPSVCSGAELTR
jgi:hypothetical protein